MSLHPGGRVPDQEAFVAFLNRLCAEHQLHGEEWENATFGQFLEALAARAGSGRDWHERHLGEPLPEDGNWTYVAHALKAATMYE